MLAAPHPMVPGTEDTQYYRGEVTGPTPEQVAWVAEHRPDDPTLDAARAAAGQGTGAATAPSAGTPATATGTVRS
jgi:NADH-quinone oxidoreductase subunit I